VRIDQNIPWLRDVPAAEMRRIVEALYRVHRLISAITDLNTLLERIMLESKQVANAEACSLLLYDAGSGALYFQVAQGETGDQQALKRDVHLKLNQGVAGAAAATRRSINVADVGRDPRFYPGADQITHFKTRSLLAVPLVDKDALIGVIEVLNKVGGGAFSDADLHVMEMFSSLAATAITNARLIEENLHTERMAAIGQALAGLSHYIKNVIAGMAGSTELVDVGLRDKNIEILERCWPIFKRSTRRISIFVQDMLAFSKPREPIYECCSMSALLDEVAQTFFGLLVQKNVALNIRTEEARDPVWVDPQGVFSCALNLVTNAADAVSLQNGRIDVVARITPDNDLVLEVGDNGPGVPEEHAHQIFEPFFSTKGTMGTGLGLAVTSKIVREHGGTITVEHGPEGGALFRIVLPDVRSRKDKGKRSGQEQHVQV
jgi:signal transduction histidine kinase